ncbi:unnamed protein product, partial [Meganyctiphanes norvegica]
MAETFDDLIKVKDIAKAFANRNVSLQMLKEQIAMLNDLDKDSPNLRRFSLMEKDADTEMVTLKGANLALAGLLLKSNPAIISDESYKRNQTEYRDTLFECVDAIEDYRKILLEKGIIAGTEDTKPDSGNINDMTNTLAQILKIQNESSLKSQKCQEEMLKIQNESSVKSQQCQEEMLKNQNESTAKLL